MGSLCTVLRSVLSKKEGTYVHRLGVHQKAPSSDPFRPKVCYFWGGVLGVVGPSGFPDTIERFKTLLPMVVAVTIAGPSVASLLLNALVYGQAGLRELRSQLFKWEG